MIILCKCKKKMILKICLRKKTNKKWYLHKLQLLPAANISIKVLAEIIQESFQVCLQVDAFCQAVQRNKRRDVVTADPQCRLQVQLQIVRLEEGAFVACCQGHVHSFTVKGLSDVVAASSQQQKAENRKHKALQGKTITVTVFFF